MTVRQLKDPIYCPLCGFTLIDDYDHFVRCFIKNAQWWSLRFREVNAYVYPRST